MRTPRFLCLAQWGLITLTALLSGCGSDALPDYNQLDRLRVLAIQAEPPEASPGTAVVLTPLISDETGKGRALEFSAKACLDPGIAFGAEPNCDEVEGAVTLAESQPVSAFPAGQNTGAGDAITVTLPPAELIFAGRTEIEQTNGVPYLFAYEVGPSGGEVVRSFKRVIVSSKSTQNQNPVIQTVRAGSTDLTELTTVEKETELTPELAAGSRETYSQIDLNGTTSASKETLTTTWFVATGELRYTRTEGEAANRLTPEQDQSPSAVVAITRDGRGGVDFLVHTFSGE